MTRRPCFWIVILSLGGWLAAGALAETFKLLNGDEVSGEPIGPNAQSVLLKKSDGTFSSRLGWTNFTQESLKKFASLPSTKRYVEPFLDLEEEQNTKKAEADIQPKPPPRLDRPDPKAGFGALFSAPLIVTLFFVLYLGNLYAAYEVALFRNYHPAFVCAAAAIAPVIGQVVFLCLPTYIKKTGQEMAAELPAEAAQSEEAAPTEAAPAEHAGATPAPSAPAHPAPTVYQRGHYTFNRRFFETKLAGFLRLVPADTEKDMVIDVKSARGEYRAQRIARILPNELILLIYKGGSSSEVTLPYTEISQVVIRHKDA
jgi:hypothetical protein